jgi:hypothetical protein
MYGHSLNHCLIPVSAVSDFGCCEFSTAQSLHHMLHFDTHLMCAPFLVLEALVQLFNFSDKI